VALIVENDRLIKEGRIHELDLIVTTSTDWTVRTWFLLTGESHKVMRGHNGSVNCVAVDPNNKTQIYTAGADYVIKCWDCVTGDLLRELKGHQDTILCLLAQNRILYSGSCDRTARAWAMEFGECTRIYWKNSGSVTCIRYLDGIRM
jgi:WD40 repeat protein